MVSISSKGSVVWGKSSHNVKPYPWQSWCNLWSVTWTDVVTVCQQVSNMSEHSGSNSGSNSSTPSTPYPAGGAGGNTAGTLPNTTATWPNLQETLQFERAASAIISDRPHTISSGDISSMSSLTLFRKLLILYFIFTDFNIFMPRAMNVLLHFWEWSPVNLCDFDHFTHSET